MYIMPLNSHEKISNFAMRWLEILTPLHRTCLASLAIQPCYQQCHAHQWHQWQQTCSNRRHILASRHVYETSFHGQMTMVCVLLCLIKCWVPIQTWNSDGWYPHSPEQKSRAFTPPIATSILFRPPTADELEANAASDHKPMRQSPYLIFATVYQRVRKRPSPTTSQPHDINRAFTAQARVPRRHFNEDEVEDLQVCPMRRLSEDFLL